MNIDDLNPRTVTTITFSVDCPVCRKHRISVNVNGGGKDWTWDEKTKTLSPSILFDGGFIDKDHNTVMCSGHFTITNGAVNLC